MFSELQFQLAIALLLFISISLCEDRQKKSKDSSIEATQTATQTTGSRPLSASAPYQAPRSVSYPFGDEDMVNNDMLNKSATSEANCADENEFIEYKPECTGPVEGVDEIYVTCLKNDLTVEPTDSIYSSSSSASTSQFNLPSLICKRCDLQKNPENTAVIINCVNCFDVGNPLDRTEPA